MSTVGLILGVPLGLAFFLLLVVGPPSRCGACGAWSTIKGHAFSIAGETIFRDAACTRCNAEMFVDSAGYIRHHGFLWLSTIPLAQKQPPYDEYLSQALEEVNVIAPEEP